jgi:uncharacterized protein
MEFEWDEDKRLANLQKHGLDFVDGRGRPIYTHPLPRLMEQRFVTIGLLNDQFVALVWTERGTATRLISPRRARDGEERAYRALFG